MSETNRVQQIYSGNVITEMYLKHRTSFPEILFKTIYDFCTETVPSPEFVVDVGCGTGGSSVPLAKYFKQVLGVDISETMIANAPTNVPGLSFRIGSAYDLSFIESGTVDLAIPSNVLHWLELDKFYPELDRILKPGGSFVAYSHGLVYVEDQKELSDYIRQVYIEILDGYWTDAVYILYEGKYRTLHSPYKKHIRNDDLKIDLDWTIDQLVGFINSWSGMEQFRTINPGVDLIGDIRRKMYQICNMDENSPMKKIFKVKAEIFTIMAHKPNGDSAI